MNMDKKELALFETTLKECGYKKMNGHYKKEDYAWWKSNKTGDETNYQIAVMVYDWSKYPKIDEVNPISISYEFLLGPNNFDGRCDLSVSDENMTPAKFELIANDFYVQIANNFLLNK